jgi:hypothetical protein
VRDVDDGDARHAEHLRLLHGLVDERARSDRDRRDTAPLEPDHVVHTARHTRPSVGERLDGEVAVEGDLLDDGLRRRLGEGLLARAANLGAPLL